MCEYLSCSQAIPDFDISAVSKLLSSVRETIEQKKNSPQPPLNSPSKPDPPKPEEKKVESPKYEDKRYSYVISEFSYCINFLHQLVHLLP